METMKLTPEHLQEILKNGYTMIDGIRITKVHLVVTKEEADRITSEAKAKGMTPKEYLECHNLSAISPISGA